MGNFDGRGALDVVAIDTTSRMTIYNGDESGLTRESFFAAGSTPQAFLAGDFNGDGLDDVTFLRTVPDPSKEMATLDEVVILWGSANGGLVAPTLVGQFDASPTP